eukprot:GFYU01015675.1.p1 GENE.GFYU01015675.1~~GFYU01015675.1.p1  ORF type:complete len:192 (+),score=29.68 GFYU01015675.1:114-689(+)
MSSDLVTEFPLPPESAAAKSGGRLFRSVMPYSSSQDADHKALGIWEKLQEEASANGKSKGILVIITPPADELEKTTNGAYSESMLQQRGFHTRQMIIDGFAADKIQVVTEALQFSQAWLEDGGFVISHCNSGFGRGSVLPSLLYAKIHNKLDKDAEATLEFVHQLDKRIVPSDKAKTFNFVKDVIAHLTTQ